MVSHTLLDSDLWQRMDVTGVLALPAEYPAQRTPVFHVCKHLKPINFWYKLGRFILNRNCYFDLCQTVNSMG